MTSLLEGHLGYEWLDIFMYYIALCTQLFSSVYNFYITFFFFYWSYCLVYEFYAAFPFFQVDCDLLFKFFFLHETSSGFLTCFQNYNFFCYLSPLELCVYNICLHNEVPFVCTVPREALLNQLHIFRTPSGEGFVTLTNCFISYSFRFCCILLTVREAFHSNSIAMDSCYNCCLTYLKN